MDENSFDPVNSNLVHAFFKSVSKRKALDRERNEGDNALNCEIVGAEISKKSVTMSDPRRERAFTEEAFFNGAEPVQHAARIAVAEGISQIEATQLERILSQLLLDL